MTKINLEIYGEGKPIVLVHGWAMHTGIWREFAKQLALNYRVICVDLPGHGRSEKIEPFTLERIGDVLVNAVPEQSCCWLGWSLGATVVLDIAGRYPERVSSLVLLAGNPLFPRAALVVIHKYLKARHPGRDCRDPEAMDGDTGTDASVTWRQLNKIKYSHPCALDPGNPCRDDGVPRALVYKDERAGWECSQGALRRESRRMSCVYGTQRVGTRGARGNDDVAQTLIYSDQNSDAGTQETQWPGMEIRLLDDFAGQLHKNCQATLLRFLSLQVNGLPEQKAILKMLKTAVSECATPDADTLQGGLDILKQADMRPVLSGLNIPVSVILGGLDTLVPVAVGQKMQQLLPSLQLNIIDRAGHVPFLSHSRETLAIISRFMDEQCI